MSSVKNQVEYRKVADLVELAGNPRTINKSQFNKLKTSIQNNPDYFEARPLILSDRTGELVVLAGNQRLKAAKALGLAEVPTVLLSGLSEEREKEIIIRDNVENGEWDFDALANEWDVGELEDWGVAVNTYYYGSMGEGGKGLVSEYLEMPVSVISSNTSRFQEREKMWKSRFGDSTEGREHESLKGLSNFSKGWVGTSAFSYTLTEILISWFTKRGDKILDPFAGGVTRGGVAATLGRDYVGVDLSSSQVAVNEEKIARGGELTGKVEYIVGDSVEVLPTLRCRADMVLSCPPYYNLEKYSEDKADLSNMPYDEFLAGYRKIIDGAVRLLKDGGFVCWVISDVRDKKSGGYVGFLHDTLEAFTDAGCVLYNDMILAGPVGVTRFRVHKAMQKTRKILRTHQNVLIFMKGDPSKHKNIGEELGKIELLQEDL